MSGLPFLQMLAALSSDSGSSSSANRDDSDTSEEKSGADSGVAIDSKKEQLLRVLRRKALEVNCPLATLALMLFEGTGAAQLDLFLVGEPAAVRALNAPLPESGNLTPLEAVLVRRYCDPLDTAVLRVLVRHGASPTKRPLLALLMRQPNVSVADVLAVAALGADPSAPVAATPSHYYKGLAKDSTALHVGAHSPGDLGHCQALLRMGASLTARDIGGRTPLHVALQHGNAGAAVLFVQHASAAFAPPPTPPLLPPLPASPSGPSASPPLRDADDAAQAWMNAADICGRTHVYYCVAHMADAVASGLVELLVSNGADPLRAAMDRKPLLKIAIERGHKLTATSLSRRLQAYSSRLDAAAARETKRDGSPTANSLASSLVSSVHVASRAVEAATATATATAITAATATATTATTPTPAGWPADWTTGFLNTAAAYHDNRIAAPGSVDPATAAVTEGR